MPTIKGAAQYRFRERPVCQYYCDGLGRDRNLARSRNGGAETSRVQFYPHPGRKLEAQSRTGATEGTLPHARSTRTGGIPSRKPLPLRASKLFRSRERFLTGQTLAFGRKSSRGIQGSLQRAKGRRRNRWKDVCSLKIPLLPQRHDINRSRYEIDKCGGWEFA